MDVFGSKFVAVYFRSGIGFLAVIFLLFGKLFLSIESFAIGTILFGALWPIKSGVTKYYISECSPDKIRGFFAQGLVSITGLLHIGARFLLLPQFLGNDKHWHYTLYIAIGIIGIFISAAVFIPESQKFLWFQ
uniref:Major facilitator superfamily (MFS) profile domain-containing protein n=1 Tax=Panagrolaimus sp. PS1159 TaxID=55785 RepID=A0AC35F8J4_9BILA